MSRVLRDGKNQVTNSYENHNGWSKGVDVVKYKSELDYIVAHTEGKVIKVVDYMKGKGTLDNEGMGYGNHLLIRHEHKYKGKIVVTLYAHLDCVNASVGATVSKGQAIGFMGNTGNSFGAHLHFEIRLYSEEPNSSNLHDTSKFEWIDPTPYLDSDLPKDETVHYRVQTGAYLIKSNAVNQAKKLKSEGFATLIKKRGLYYRVQVGAYTQKANAERMAQQLKSKGYGTYITTEAGTDVSF